MNITNELLANLSPEEKSEVLKILEEMMSTGTSQSLQKLYDEDYTEVPVDIDTFIDSPEYAGWFSNNGKDIYPYWRNQLRQIFDSENSYSEIAISGSIGTGKSHIAVLALAYCLYKLMCLKDPHGFYKIAKGGYIYIVFFNATLELSQGVAFTKFQSLLQNSPWFMKKGKVTGTKYLEYIPNGPIRFTIGSQMEHSIGKDILFGIMDEVNFVKGANTSMEKSKIMKTYSSVLERINSRFIIGGKTQGKLFLVSSKKSEYDFIESYIKKQQGKPGIYVIDAALWDVKPQGTYSGKTFKVAVGGSNLPSRIMNDDEDIETVEKQGYRVIEPPIEFRNRFELDLPTALMNIAGISISNVTKFISYDNLIKCYNDSKNPFTSTILMIGMNDSLKIQDFFIPKLVPPEIYSMPIFIHLDMSVTGDITGIGAVAAMGYKYFNEYSLDEGDVVPTKKLMYRHVFTVGIKCPSGTEISFQKNRDFIYYLKYELGWNIKGVSTDGFQSVDTRQQLITMGFEDVSLVSLDKTPNGYLSCKAAINEKRISMLNIPELETELINLERDNMSGKIDHNVDNTKDLSDGFTGALYNASLHEPDLSFHLIEYADTIISVNDSADIVDDRQTILDNMVPTTFKKISRDMNILDTTPNEPEDNTKSEMTIGEAFKKYISDNKNIIKVKEEEESEGKNQDEVSSKDEEIRRKFLEVKARQMSSNISSNNDLQQMEDINNGIIMY